MNDGAVAMQGTPPEVFTHAEELAAMGLDVPQVNRVILRAAAIWGWTVDAGIFTVEQAVQALTARERRPTMLKDITLGQYFPGETLIHRLDPRTKLLAVIVFIVALFLAKSFVSYGLVLVFLIACIRISRVHLKVILRGLKPLLIIIVLTATFEFVLHPGRPSWCISGSSPSQKRASSWRSS